MERCVRNGMRDMTDSPVEYIYSRKNGAGYVVAVIAMIKIPTSLPAGPQPLQCAV